MADRISVQRANVVLDISPDEKDYYMSMGYSVIDETGAIIEQAMSLDPSELQILVAKLKDENEKLKNENAELSQKLEDALKKKQPKNKQTQDEE